jgi:hypothetical protein
MSYPIPDLQRAVIARLRAYAPLTAVVAQRIYDTAPADAAYPFVTINSISATERDTDTSDGLRVALAVSVFAQGVDARAKVQRHAAHVIDALHRNAAALTVTGHAVVMCSYQSSLVFRTPDDGGGAHCVVNFLILTEQAELANGY